MKHSLIVLLIIVLLNACKAERDPCLEPKQVNVQMQFVHWPDSATSVADTALPQLNFGAMDGDTLKLLYFGASNINRLAFPLDDGAEEVSYWIQPDSSILMADTLKIRYLRKLHFISNACGYNHFYELQSIDATRNLLDSAFILQEEVTNDVNTTHIRLVY